MEENLFKRGLNVKLTFFIVLLSYVLAFISIYGQEAPVKYSKARIYIAGKQDILSLNEAGLVFDHIDYQETYFDVVLNNWEVDLLRKISPPYEILVDDLEAE